MKDFLFVNGNSTKPSINLAQEEFLLKNKTEYFISLWQNEPSVIIGTSQNALSEVDFDYANKKGINVVRRITGGGAVYHDFGNVCYTVIGPYEEGVNYFHKFSAPVIEYLKTLGLNAEFSGRNDLLIDGKKISGTAETVYKNRIMHHGTLLFDSDLSVLSRVLKPNPLKLKSKGIKSVKSRVANVKEFLDSNITTKQFINGLTTFFKDYCKEYVLTENELLAIKTLAKEKYETYEWNVAYSPKGQFSITIPFASGIITFSFDINNGQICNPEFFGDFFTLNNLEELKRQMIGKRLTKQDLVSAFYNVSEYILGLDTEIVVSALLK